MADDKILWIPPDISDMADVVGYTEDGRPILRDAHPDEESGLHRFLAEGENEEPEDTDDMDVDEEAQAPGEPTTLKPGMTMEEIKAAGLQVDLPFESGSAGDFAGLQYDDLGPDKKWTPPEGFRVRHVDYDIPGGELGSKSPAQEAAPEGEESAEGGEEPQKPAEGEEK